MAGKEQNTLTQFMKNKRKLRGWLKKILGLEKKPVLKPNEDIFLIDKHKKTK